MRTFFSMLLGILVGAVVAAGVVVLARELFPAPELSPGQEADASDPIPLPVLLTYPAAFALGSLFGALAAARLARRGWQPAVMTVGAVMLVTASFFMLQFPHPLWAWIPGVVAPILLAWIGGLMTHNLALR